MKKKLPLIMAFLAGFILYSCAPKMVFGVSPLVPIAEGAAKVTTNKNGNYELSVKVINLVQPQRLTPSKEVYVVWTQTSGEVAKNVGMIKVTKKLLSKTLVGKFKTIVLAKPTTVFITAEDNGLVQYPGTQIVLKTL